MKKMFLCSLGLFLSLSTAAFADNIDISQLNAQIEKILAPLQSNTTQTSLIFNNIDIDQYRTNNLSLKAYYHKQGEDNKFDVNMDNLTYNYGDGTAPTTAFKFSIDTDLSKIVSQELLNEIIPQVAVMWEEMVVDQTDNEFGEALNMENVVTSVAQDAQGNYTGLSAISIIDINLDKLPEDMSLRNVMLTKTVFSVLWNVETGLQVNSYIISNPAHEKFEEDQTGLKESLEKLLANDEEEIEGIAALLFFFDEMATDLLNGELLKKNLFKYLS